MQLLIGLQNDQNDFSLKEFYAFEVAREIGLFDKDDDDEGNKERMIFSFMYFSLLLVIERTLFNFDSDKFIKEQIIFQLKKGLSDLNELKNLYDLVICQSSLSVLNKVISEVSIPSEKVNKGKSENDITFKLKDGIEVNIISAINSINQEKGMMNVMISTNPEYLLQIQEFEPEETYFFNQNENLNVRLKDFLFTPTVLAFVYKTLRKNESNLSQKIDLNDHLAMNILILISKFINESNENPDLNHSFSENLIINYDSSFAGLISQLKEFIYDYNHKKNQKKE